MEQLRRCAKMETIDPLDAPGAKSYRSTNRLWVSPNGNRTKVILAPVGLRLRPAVQWYWGLSPCAARRRLSGRYERPERAPTCMVEGVSGARAPTDDPAN